MSVEFIGYIAQQQFLRNRACGPARFSIRPTSRPWRRRMRTPASTARCWRFTRPRRMRLQIGQHVLGVTDKLKVMIAQRPGFTAPTLLARQLATVDQLLRRPRRRCTSSPAAMPPSCGRTAIRLDDKDERYARTSEFLDIVRAEWTQRKAVRLRRQILPGRERLLAGEAASAAGGIYDLRRRRFGCRHRGRGQARRHVRAVGRILRAGARCHGARARRRREAWPADAALQPVGAPDPRPIPRRSAWAKADEILARATALQDKTGYRKPADGHATAGARRLLALAGAGHADRQAAVDRDRQTDRRQQQHHGAGRHARAGRRSVRRLLRSRHQPFPDPRLRSADRRHRIWPRTDPADATARSPSASRRTGVAAE